MKRLSIKRWMLGASAMMILSNTTGCSVQKDKCQEDHLYISTMERIKSKNNRRPYLEKDTMIPMKLGDSCVEEIDLKNAIRESFYAKHSLIPKHWEKEYPDHIELNEYNVFGEFENGIEQNGKIMYDDTLREIEEDKTTIDFIDYIVCLEERKQGRYLSDKEVAEMFSVNGTYYSIKSEKEDENYSFELFVDKERYKNDPYREGSSECVKQTIKSDDLEIKKAQSISISPNGTTTNIRTYSVDQFYELIFSSKTEDENVRLVLDNTWEILNEDIMKEKYECRNYGGSLMLEYKDEKIKKEVTEEQYDSLAEMMVTSVQNKDTLTGFLETNDEVLTEYFQEDYTNLEIQSQSLIKKK